MNLRDRIEAMNPAQRFSLLASVAIPRLNLAIDCTPPNPKGWMGTSFAYWEGPISFAGSHRGVGYLELRGYWAKPRNHRTSCWLPGLRWPKHGR